MIPRIYLPSAGLSAALLCMIALAGFNSAWADENSDQWTVAKVVGSPLYSPGNDRWITMEPGMALPDGALIKTADNEQAVLIHGGDTMSVYANSRIRLRPQRGTLTSVIQYLGEVLFQVEHIDGRRFEVNTPYMIAGVKGTTFGVAVAASAASAYLLEGRLAVTGARSGTHTELTSGLYALVEKSATNIHRDTIPDGLQRQWSERRTEALTERSSLSSLPPQSAAPRHAPEDVKLGAPVVGLDRAAAQTTLPQSLQRVHPDPEHAMEGVVESGRRMQLQQRAMDRARNAANPGAPVDTTPPVTVK